ncbi:MAG: GEVED domain-containing protein, partial [Acidobacteriota bacterium]|nr:GEVED domain-containing protein [Acidobacteriota bacterium]
TSFFQGCTGDTWRVIGMDIRFRRDGTAGADWYFGANPTGQAPGEDDFETVALHELGHGLQHDHINDPEDPMYFSISIGANKRILSTADTNGGLDIVGHSAGFSACGGVTGMLSFDCAAPPTSNFLGSPRGTCGSSLSVDFSDMSQNGPTAWSWDFGDSGSSSARHPSHTYTTQGVFNISLDASNANGNDMEMKTEYVVVQDAPLAASCSPTFTGHNNCCGIGIKNVAVDSIDKTTGTPKDGDPLEEDFTCSDFGLLQAGTVYPISVTTGSGNNEDVKVYIDWDNDGVLASGELAFSSDNTQPIHSGSISVPASAVRDTTLRMRVLSDFASQNIVSPCENIEYGQVENYSVIVAADAPAGGPGAVPDSSLALTKNANPALIDFSWSASCGAGAADYTIHEGTLGTFYSHSSAVCSTGGATSFTGLAPAAGHRYFLVAPISATDEGSYGSDSSSSQRPVSTTSCIATQDSSSCP